MRTNKKIVATLAVLLTTLTLQAGKNVIPAVTPIEPIATVSPVPMYVGAGLVYGLYRGCVSSGCDYEDVTYGAMLRAGYEWNQYVGLEARFLATEWKADPLGGQKLRHAGLFLKPSMPLGDDFNAYGLLGYGWTKTITGGNGNLATVSKSGFSAGIGLEYDLSSKSDDKDENGLYGRAYDGQADQEKGWGLFVDYQRLLINSNVPKMDVFSAGVTYDF